MKRTIQKAVAYLRTSSAANVGADKDSDKRQLAAISAFATAHGYEVLESYYDAAVSGADPVTERPGFIEMLRRVVSNGAKTIIVESPDRFARDLAVQLAGHDMLKSQGIALIPATAQISLQKIPPLLSWFGRCWEPLHNSRRRPSLQSLQSPENGNAMRRGNAKAESALLKLALTQLPLRERCAGRNQKVVR